MQKCIDKKIITTILNLNLCEITEKITTEILNIFKSMKFMSMREMGDIFLLKICAKINTEY